MGFGSVIWGFGRSYGAVGFYGAGGSPIEFGGEIQWGPMGFGGSYWIWGDNTVGSYGDGGGLWGFGGGPMGFWSVIWGLGGSYGVWGALWGLGGPMGLGASYGV